MNHTPKIYTSEAYDPTRDLSRLETAGAEAGPNAQALLYVQQGDEGIGTAESWGITEPGLLAHEPVILAHLTGDDGKEYIVMRGSKGAANTFDAIAWAELTRDSTGGVGVSEFRRIDSHSVDGVAVGANDQGGPAFVVTLTRPERADGLSTVSITNTSGAGVAMEARKGCLVGPEQAAGAAESWSASAAVPERAVAEATAELPIIQTAANDQEVPEAGYVGRHNAPESANQPAPAEMPADDDVAQDMEQGQQRTPEQYRPLTLAEALDELEPLTAEAERFVTGLHEIARTEVGYWRDLLDGDVHGNSPGINQLMRRIQVEAMDRDRNPTGKIEWNSDLRRALEDYTRQVYNLVSKQAAVASDWRVTQKDALTLVHALGTSMSRLDGQAPVQADMQQRAVKLEQQVSELPITRGIGYVDGQRYQGLLIALRQADNERGASYAESALQAFQRLKQQIEALQSENDTYLGRRDNSGRHVAPGLLDTTEDGVREFRAVCREQRDILDAEQAAAARQ